jgi:hypothetical protein
VSECILMLFLLKFNSLGEVFVLISVNDKTMTQRLTISAIAYIKWNQYLQYLYNVPLIFDSADYLLLIGIKLSVTDMAQSQRQSV